MGFSEEIPSAPPKIVPVFLEPGSSNSEIFFNVDTAPSFMVDIASPSDSFNVTLSDPQNQIITPENVADFNGEYVFDEIQNTRSFIGVPTLLSGFHYIASKILLRAIGKLLLAGKIFQLMEKWRLCKYSCKTI